MLLQPAPAPLDEFFEHLRGAQMRLLMLDYDGTLAPFHRDPARAAPYPGVLPLLDKIQADARNRLVIVSGRWTRDLLPLLPLARRPEIWGCHGWERLYPDDRYNLAPVSEAALHALVALDELGVEVRTLGGRCEQKPVSVAFHWRGLRQARAEAVRALACERWALLDDRESLCLYEFDGGIEFRAPGRNKGYAVEILLAEAGPDAVAAFIGDDLTDEDAFAAMAGRGISVLARAHARTTGANYRVTPPDELLTFLKRWTVT